MDDLKLSELGPKFEHHEMFPARTNTGNSYFYYFAICFSSYIHEAGFQLSNFLSAEFVQVLSKSHLKMRVWERGAGISDLHLVSLNLDIIIVYTN